VVIGSVVRTFLWYVGEKAFDDIDSARIEQTVDIVIAGVCLMAMMDLVSVSFAQWLFGRFPSTQLISRRCPFSANNSDVGNGNDVMLLSEQFCSCA